MSVLKNLVRKELSRRGLQVVRQQATNGRSIDISAMSIEYCTSVHGRGAVLQIGANDGLLTDPVQASIRKHQLNALLVEPLPDAFERLSRNFAGVQGARLANVAIGRQAGRATIYRIDPAAEGMPEWIAGTATFSRDVLLKHKAAPGVPSKRYEQSIQEISVPVVTVSQLLETYDDLGEISIVHIDTEGHDFEVIKSVLDAGLSPRLISYEHKHLTLQDQVECRDALGARGYAFLSNEHDTVALR